MVNMKVMYLKRSGCGEIIKTYKIKNAVAHIAGFEI